MLDIAYLASFHVFGHIRIKFDEMIGNSLDADFAFWDLLTRDE